MRMHEADPRIVIMQRAFKSLAHRHFEVSTTAEAGLAALQEMRAENADPLVLLAIDAIIAEKRFLAAWRVENPDEPMSEVVKEIR